jgi:hypothetical protein
VSASHSLSLGVVQKTGGTRRSFTSLRRRSVRAPLCLQSPGVAHRRRCPSMAVQEQHRQQKEAEALAELRKNLDQATQEQLVRAAGGNPHQIADLEKHPLNFMYIKRTFSIGVATAVAVLSPLTVEHCPMPLDVCRARLALRCASRSCCCARDGCRAPAPGMVTEFKKDGEWSASSCCVNACRHTHNAAGRASARQMTMPRTRRWCACGRSSGRPRR